MIDLMVPFMKALSLYLHRCRRLILHLGQVNSRDSARLDRGPWDLIPPLDLPVLEELDISAPYHNSLQLLAPTLRSAPIVRKLSIDGYPPSLLAFASEKLFSQLEYLRSNTAESVQRCCWILRRSPRLTQCWFDLHFSDHIKPSDESNLPNVLYQRLCKLCVGPTHLGFFFNSVTFPALQSLSIDGKWKPEIHSDELEVTHDAIWGQIAFLAFLTRSRCCLTKLSFFNVSLTSEELVEILEYVSSTLIELHIEGGKTKFITPSVMNVLTYRPPDPPPGALDGRFFCPLLERIRIRGYIFEPIGLGEYMVDMLESRYRQSFPVEGLKQLRWAFVGGAYNEDQWERITALEEDGLELLVLEEGSQYLPDYLGDPSLFE